MGDLWIVGVLALMMVVFGLLNSDLFTQGAWLNISNYSVEFLILAVGQTFVILTGGIDLSVGAALGFTGMVSGAVMQSMLAPTTVPFHDRRRLCRSPGAWRADRLRERLHHYPPEAPAVYRHAG